MLAASIVVLLALLLSGTGCAKKPKVSPPPATSVAPPPPSPAPAPAPTVSLNASPSAIEKGQSTTLTWNSTNAAGVTIDNGVGTVESSGSRTVSPSSSTTYQAKATSPGGTAVAEARVTVTVPVVTPPPPPAISDAAYFSNNIKDAFFDLDQYSIRDDARAALQADARALAERPGIRFTIEGHCDERGSEKYNLALGDRRANAAKEFLVSQGINASRIDTISYGKERNFCEEHNEECWQLNRRAHLVMR
jgi:peptidoglycan-associated lipoprotein